MVKVSRVEIYDVNDVTENPESTEGNVCRIMIHSGGGEEFHVFLSKEGLQKLEKKVDECKRYLISLP